MITTVKIQLKDVECQSIVVLRSQQERPKNDRSQGDYKDSTHSDCTWSIYALSPALLLLSSDSVGKAAANRPKVQRAALFAALTVDSAADVGSCVAGHETLHRVVESERSDSRSGVVF